MKMSATYEQNAKQGVTDGVEYRLLRVENTEKPENTVKGCAFHQLQRKLSLLVVLPRPLDF